MLQHILITMIVVCSGKEISSSIDFEDLSLKLGEYTYRGQKFTGIAEKKEGPYTYEIPFDNGKIHGTKKEYLLISGKQIHIKSLAFSKGILEGKSIHYFQNGKVKYVGLFKKGKKEGLHYHYLDQGDIWRVESYKNGLLNGKCVTFHENGKVSKEDYYKNGKYHGVCREFFDNGKVKIESSFHEGERIGIHREYTKDGKIIIEENYEKDPF